MQSTATFSIVLAACLAGGCTSNNLSQPVGTACRSSADCASALCLPLDVTGTRGACTARCDSATACPAGWWCAPPLPGEGSVCQCQPTLELCDGLDNDCDGFVDNACIPVSIGVDFAVPAGPDFGPMTVDLAQPAVTTQKIDFLLVVDNSPSIGPVITNFKTGLPTLVQRLQGFAAAAPTSFHIGLVTTDLGAGATTPSSNCKPGGGGARLRTLGPTSPATCTGLGGGKNFIDLDQSAGTNNLNGQTLAQALDCMVSQGDTGCGFEMPLEAAYRALHDSIPENVGFLRPDALLAVLFVTNEDDCSAPSDTDLFDLAKSAQYGAPLSYRCTNYGVMCGSPPQLMPYGDSGGPLLQCVPATAAVGGKLFEIDRYLQFFTQPGGVKANPRAVLLATLAAPDMPVASIVANPATYQPCTGALDPLKCAVLLQHSCTFATIFGDPPVRLSTVARAAPTFVEGTVCRGDYSDTLGAIGDALLDLRRGL